MENINKVPGKDFEQVRIQLEHIQSTAYFH